MNINKLCETLNNILEKREEDFVDKLNYELACMFEQGYNLYFNRQIYIDCGFNDDAMHDLVIKTNKCKFVPSDDPDEHPGVVVHYKNE
jgi:hypothetical protein